MRILPAIGLERDGFIAVGADAFMEAGQNPQDRGTGPSSSPSYLSLDDVLANPGIDRSETVMVLDVDGLARNRPNVDTIQDLADSKEVVLNGGARTVEDMIDLIVAGASVCLFDSRFMTDVMMVDEARDLTDNFGVLLWMEKGVVRSMSSLDGIAPTQAVTELVRKEVDTIVLWPADRDLGDSHRVYAREGCDLLAFAAAYELKGNDHYTGFIIDPFTETGREMVP